MRLLNIVITGWMVWGGVSQGIADQHTPDVFELVKAQKIDMQARFEAELYDLDAEEMERVAVLRVADKPFGVANLSAIELLGKYAVSESAREKYARKYLAAAAENTVKSNAWALTIERVSRERDYIAQALAKVPSVESMLMDLNIDLGGFEDADFAAVSRGAAPQRVVSLFVTLDCDQCDGQFRQAHRDVKTMAIDQLNVIFVGSTIEDQESIFDWARSVNILKKELNAARIVLHIDGDQWRELRDSDEVPQTIRHTG